MQAEDFSVWLAALSGMSVGNGPRGWRRWRRPPMRRPGRQRRQAERGCARNDWGRAGRAPGLSALREPGYCRLGPFGRAFALSLQGVPAHLQRADQDADGASAQEGEAARPRPGDDRGQEPGQDGELCGVHPTTAFRWRHRFLRAPADDKPRTLSDIVEGMRPSSSNCSRAVGPTCRAGHASGGARPAIRAPIRTTFPSSSPATGKAPTFDAVLPQVTSAAIGAALAGLITPANHLVGDGGLPIAGFARRAGIPFHPVPSPGKPASEAPHLHINNVNAYHSRLKQWLARFNRVATKNLPSYLGWRRALEPGANPSTSTNGSSARSETAHINR